MRPCLKLVRIVRLGPWHGYECGGECGHVGVVVAVVVEHQGVWFVHAQQILAARQRFYSLPSPALRLAKEAYTSTSTSSTLCTM